MFISQFLQRFEVMLQFSWVRPPSGRSSRAVTASAGAAYTSPLTPSRSASCQVAPPNTTPPVQVHLDPRAVQLAELVGEVHLETRLQPVVAPADVRARARPPAMVHPRRDPRPRCWASTCRPSGFPPKHSLAGSASAASSQVIGAVDRAEGAMGPERGNQSVRAARTPSPSRQAEQVGLDPVRLAPAGSTRLQRRARAAAAARSAAGAMRKQIGVLTAPGPAGRWSVSPWRRRSPWAGRPPRAPALKPGKGPAPVAG